MSEKTKRKKKPKAKKVSYKDKSWFECFAPKSFNFESLGEIIGLEDTIVGRTIEVLLYDFTDDFRDINLKIKFKIIDVNEEAKKCNSLFFGHQYTNDFIRSLVGRGASKIQIIINLTTKDNYKFRLTIVCITIKRARSSQMIIIRKIMGDIIQEFAKTLNHEKFIKGMIAGEFENQIKRVAKTLYPLSSATVIKSKLLSIPEGGQDEEVPDNDFDIVEVDVKRSRKSDIKRSERISVKKFNRQKSKERRSRKEPSENKSKEEPSENESKSEGKTSTEST